jgi:hypothetical protein
MQTVIENDLLEFYMGRRPHPSGVKIDRVWQWTDDKLAESSWALNWLFPSGLVRKLTIERFKNDPELKRQLMTSFCRVLDFYGFEPRVAARNRITIVESGAFEKKAQRWLTPANYHFKRITRILETLMALGFEHAAVPFLEALKQVYQEHPAVVGYTTYLYWRDAVKK